MRLRVAGLCLAYLCLKDSTRAPKRTTSGPSRARVQLNAQTDELQRKCAGTYHDPVEDMDLSSPRCIDLVIPVMRAYVRVDR